MSALQDLAAVCELHQVDAHVTLHWSGRVNVSVSPEPGAEPILSGHGTDPDAAVRGAVDRFLRRREGRP